MKATIIAIGVLVSSIANLPSKESAINYVKESAINDAIFMRLRLVGLQSIDFDGKVADVVCAVSTLLKDKRIADLAISFRGDRTDAFMDIMNKPANVFFAPQLEKDSAKEPVSAWDIIQSLAGIEGGWVAVDGDSIHVHLLNFAKLSPEEEKKNLDEFNGLTPE